MRLTSHRLSQLSPWPEPLKSLRDVLAEPIPDWFYNDNEPYPRLSSVSSKFVSDLQSRAQDRTIPSSDVLMCSADDTMRVILDISLSTCAYLRDAIREDRPFGPLTTDPIWVFLMKSLSQACRANVRLLDGTPFIIPSAIAPGYTNEEQLPMGYAQLFLSQFIDKDDLVQSTREMAVEVVLVHEMDSPPESLPSATYGTESCSSDNLSSDTSSIDLPLEAHMLPGHGRRFYADVGILAVVDIRNSVPILGSFLEQRRVWGITQPAVVIVPSNCGTLASIAAAWMEDVNDETLMHIACCDFDQVQDEALGVFDLADPASCFLFSRLIFRLLESWHDSSSEICRTREHLDEAYVWRADHVDTTPRADKVRAWLSSLMAHERSEAAECSLGSGPNPSSSQTERKSKAASESASKSTDSHYSNSIYAAFSDYNGTTGTINRPSYSESLIDRRVMSVTGTLLCNVGTAVLSDLILSEINAKVKIFQENIEFVQIEKWKSKESLPLAAASEDGFFEEMGKRSPGSPFLDDNLVAIVEDRFSNILRVSRMAQTVKQRTQDGANEAEHRQAWNLALYFFSHLTSEFDVSPDVILERTMNLATNVTFGQLHQGAYDAVTERNDFLVSILEYCAANQASWKHSPRSESYKQAFSAVLVALGMQNSCIQDNELLTKDIEARFKFEPKSATCDGVVSCRWEGFGAQILETMKHLSPTERVTALDAFRLFLPVKPPSKSLNASPEFATAEEKARLEQSLNPKKAEEKYLTRASRIKPKDKCGSQAPHKKMSAVQSNKILRKLEYLRPFRPTPPSSKKQVSDDPDPSKSLLNVDIFFPLILVENKKEVYGSFLIAVNQGRGYIAAALYFLESLGIVDYEVFTLVTNGEEGAMMMGWLSSKTKTIYIVDRAVPRFNISQPVCVYHLATALLRIKLFDEKRWKDNAKLDKEAIKRTFLAQIKEKGLPKWSMNATVPKKEDEASENTQASEKVDVASELVVREDVGFPLVVQSDS